MLPRPGGVVPAWSISDAFPEDVVSGAASLDPGHVAERTWSGLVSEPSGLTDLSRINGLKRRP